MQPAFDRRRSGVLLHPTSLPDDSGYGKLNQHAYRFIDFLQASGFGLWQLLPLGPTHPDGSPYQSYSCYALNPKLLDPCFMLDWPGIAEQKADELQLSTQTRQGRFSLFREHAHHEAAEAFSVFCKLHDHWLSDYASYCLLKETYEHQSWLQWPSQYRHRHADALAELASNHASELDAIKFEQFCLYRAWQDIKTYANDRNIYIFGDLPIFVSHDSADVWANQEQFYLDEDGQPITVAGVPPDYFSETGQRWGNPHYRWSVMEEDDFAWWQTRFQHQLDLFDLVRIDHFRGLESFWEIPAHEETAINGSWQPAPGHKLLQRFHRDFESLPIVAEDLGIITPEVNALRDAFKLPGMKILHFAFDGDASNPYLPHNHELNSVIYTGTHDNDTTLGWWHALAPDIQARCLDYLNFPALEMPWPLIRTALASVSNLAIVPMQDLLMLDGSHRMNTPGTTDGNWAWQFDWSQVPEHLSEQLYTLNVLYGRC